ncbi:U6 snRNA-associated Sm-like protein LSm7 [Golovinomyces cichoracearum]|uniref:U6 snRNA-associated Sm-like protein LSm7 n=1 Tax=Golovinomyces cichoracearum TaxID=62708 RepID=A0A420IYQ2_9PEZI|nr:U6 snRNA-associated Sm-like protein LSm7 [Golovinomyces cichoracearum]
MSQRGQYRGNRGANRGNRGGRGGYDSSRVGSSADRPKKENILDLGKYMDKKISVKMTGGREGNTVRGEVGLTYVLPLPKILVFKLIQRIVTGFLKGYDALMNLVLDDVEESMHDSQENMLIKKIVDDENKITTRSLGLVVVRGTLLVLISPVDGSEEIANPFVQGS